MAEELNRRLNDTLQQTAINTFGSVKQRVAAHLLDLASDQQGQKGRIRDGRLTPCASSLERQRASGGSLGRPSGGPRKCGAPACCEVLSR